MYVAHHSDVGMNQGLKDIASQAGDVLTRSDEKEIIMSAAKLGSKTQGSITQKIKNLGSNRWLVIGLFIIGLLVVLFLVLVPHTKYEAQDYFTQYEKHKVNGDVEKLLGRVDDFLKLQPDDFAAFENFPLRGYKYSVAFTGYGLANVAFIEPSRRRQMADYLDKMIVRYNQYDVQQDWWVDGYGPNANLKEGNVMYKGHLNLLYGLYELIADDKKYESLFKKTSQDIIERSSLNTNGRNEHYYGMTCEPANYYIECNTISIYSIKLYDKLYGEDHSELIESWYNYISTQLADKKTGLFCEVYHPTTDYPEPQMISYNNGWALLFLNALHPEFTQAKYATYKNTFIKDFFWYAYAIDGGPIEQIRPPLSDKHPTRPTPEARADNLPDGLGCLFAFFLASEVKDADLYNKMLNGLSKVGTVPVDSHSPAGIVVVDVATNLALQGPLLFGKTNIGLARLLEFAEQKHQGHAL
jgi:hypothetical protein